MAKKNKEFTFEDLSELVVKDFGDYVNWVEVDQSGELPRLHFMWEDRFTVDIPADISDAEVKRMYPEASISKSPGYGAKKDRRYLWASTGYLQHRWFCNFRRYGWSWSPSEDGHYSYGHGVTYANGQDSGLPCKDGRQVVRDTAIAAYWANNHGVPSLLFHSNEAKVAFEWMVNDALENISDYAEHPLRSRERYPRTDFTHSSLVRPTA
jgi:hypothetical protein